MKIKRDEVIIVYGPAAINIVDGAVEVFNKKFRPGDRIIVHKLKNYVVHAIEDSELEINMGEGAYITQPDQNEPYLERLELVEKIVESDPRRIMVIGGIDTGKSTIAVMLLNKFLEKNYKPAVIDSDVGQADIGPPCFISLSYPEQQVIWMRELKPAAMKFIGDIKPQYHVEGIIYKLHELVEKAEADDRRPVIIDTDGWIGDEYALNYKHRMISEIRPDTIVVTDELLAGFFKKYEILGSRVYVFRAPANRRIRDREERKTLRRDKYREYLEDAPLKKIELDKIILVGLPLFHGVELPKPMDNEALANSIVYVARTYDTLHVVVNQHLGNELVEAIKKIYGVQKIKFYSNNFGKKLYVAVSDGVTDYPGLIEKIDFDTRTIMLKTRFNGEIKIIKFTNIYLADDYSEKMI
jgi:polynucleotide 5'-hydroxyl-kinase GRC3/NOL9